MALIISVLLSITMTAAVPVKNQDARPCTNPWIHVCWVQSPRIQHFSLIHENVHTDRRLLFFDQFFCHYVGLSVWNHFCFLVFVSIRHNICFWESEYFYAIFEIFWWVDFFVIFDILHTFSNESTRLMDIGLVFKKKYSSKTILFIRNKTDR